MEQEAAGPQGRVGSRPSPRGHSLAARAPGYLSPGPPPPLYHAQIGTVFGEALTPTLPCPSAWAMPLVCAVHRAHRTESRRRPAPPPEASSCAGRAAATSPPVRCRRCPRRRPHRTLASRLPPPPRSHRPIYPPPRRCRLRRGGTVTEAPAPSLEPVRGSCLIPCPPAGERNGCLQPLQPPPAPPHRAPTQPPSP
eukprot:scaffold9647_cov107-Isochrysis_galbana.AAC.2